MRQDRAFVATDDAGILGIAGFEENRKGLFRHRAGTLWREYGLSGPLRAVGLAALERRAASDTLLMDGIAVEVAARGRGIGTQLLAALCDHARSLGKARVRLDVIDTNPRAQKPLRATGIHRRPRRQISDLPSDLPVCTVTTMYKSL